MVQKMYYSGFIAQLLFRGEYDGYPHNGGEHTLHLKMSEEDVLAFLELVRETFKNTPTHAEEFIQSAYERMGVQKECALAA